MKKLLQTFFVAFPAVVVSYTASAELTVEPLKETVSWTFKNDGQPVMVYAFDPRSFKPYIKELYSSTGKNVLRDSPSDHLHHHALMYGIRVNGVNFWEETPGCGIQKVVETAAPETSDVNSVPQATLRQTIHWVAPEDAFLPNTNAPALLIEHRKITVGVNSRQEEVVVEWRSQFEVGTKTNTVVLTGANYHGLGMRYPQSFDPVASHFTAEGSPDLSDNKQDVSAHRWTAVFFDVPSAPVTLVLFGDPRNARGSANYFSMKTPFAYLSATQGLDKEALVYRKGDRFELGYLVCVYPQKKTVTSLDERAGKWVPAGAK